MTYEELNDTIYRLNEKAEYLRSLYEDNGGEETTETIIEERIIELQELKKDLADAILTGESESITQLSNEELLELLE